MPSHFRPTTSGDAEAISTLMKLVFGIKSDHPGLNVKQMNWKYWQPCSEWPGSRGFVVERDGDVLAHGAVIPLTLAWSDQRLRLVHLIDWAARRDCTGAGIALLKRVGQMVDGIFVPGGSHEAQKILPALRFRPLGPATRFILPLNPLTRLPESWRSWQGAARFGRSLALSTVRGSFKAVPREWRARLISSPELISSALANHESSSKIACFMRSTAALTHLMQCPSAPASLYSVEREGAVCGYFVLMMAGRQCRIADAWLVPDREDNWHNLFTLAIQETKRRTGIAELVAVANRDVEMRALRRAGFPRCGQIPLWLWMRKGNIPGAVRYQMADGDYAYLHDGM
jgi:hypothetical protein